MLFRSRFFNHGYAEELLSGLTEDDYIAYTADPVTLEEIDNQLIDNALNQWCVEHQRAYGYYPTEEEYQQARDRIKYNLLDKGNERFIQFRKSVLDDMSYFIRFDMTQEAVDTKLRSDALIAVKNDPTSDKSKSKIEDELLSLQGLNPRNYDKSKEEKINESQQPTPRGKFPNSLFQTEGGY